MKRDNKYFVYTTSIFLIFFLISDLILYQMNGKLSIGSNDNFGTLIYYLKMPGSIIGAFLTIIIYQNIHNYDFYFLWIVSIIFSSVIYGLLFYYLYPGLRRNKTAQISSIRQRRKSK